MPELRDFHPSLYDPAAVRAAVADHQHLARLDLRAEGEQQLLSVDALDSGPPADLVADSIGNHALLRTVRAARSA
jgi:hypothetical protein